MTIYEVIDRIVDEIIDNISDRSGLLSDVWNEIDFANQNEIKSEWKEIIYEKLMQPPPQKKPIERIMK